MFGRVEYLKLSEKCNHPPRKTFADKIHNPTQELFTTALKIYVSWALKAFDARRNERLEAV
jgi:hypothetical protein